MAKGKYEYWLTDDGLLLLEAWARDGAIDEIIAEKCGISAGTLYEWKKRFPEIREALKKGKEVVDVQVENALLNKALSGDTTAIIFWLKNRRAKEWRDRKNLDMEARLDVETPNPYDELTTEELRKLAGEVDEK